MLIERDRIKDIWPFLMRDEFLSIIGPRQAGKTTLLKMMKKRLAEEVITAEGNIHIITFEDRRFLMEFEADPVLFIKAFLSKKTSGKCYVMIDEFQYAKDAGQKLKLIYDTVDNVKIIVTGSSSLDIRAKVGKFMVGRMIDFTLYPFNFKERLLARNKRLAAVYEKSSSGIESFLLGRRATKQSQGRDLFPAEFIPEYEDYVVWGGYPAVTLAEENGQRGKLLHSIYDNYILKDIKSALELTTERNLFLLSQYLATQVGNISVYQNLSQISGLDYRGLKKHLAVLEETFVCRAVRPFFKNRQKELIKNTKIFFIDMGFRNSLMENMNGLPKRPDAGAMVENSAFIRLNELFGGMNKINFWRTKAGAEVDFVLHLAGEIVPIEIKYSSFDKNQISKSMAAFIDHFNPARAVILTKDYWGSAKRAKTSILFAPIYYL